MDKLIPMQYRRFGRTELKMPLITCGGMRYQHKWDDIPFEEVPLKNQENLERIVDRALSLGINHFETARGYGSSEVQLGRILPHCPRDEILVQTKVAPMDSTEKFRKKFEISMERMNLEFIDLFSLHGINNRTCLENALRPGGCLEAAREFQKEGRVRFIGFSTHGATPIIKEAIETGEFDYVNLHWYFINEFNWPAVEAAAREDMGVFIISPNDKGGKLYDPPEKLSELCKPLNPMQFNDLFCWNRPEVHTLSMGVSRPEDFDDHIAALAYLDRSDEIIRPIETRLREELDHVLGADWVKDWHRGIPDHDMLPGGINVRLILRIWNWAKGLDMVDFARMQYNILGSGGHWLPGEKAVNFDDGAILKALADSSFAERIPNILREAHKLLSGEDKKRLSES